MKKFALSILLSLSTLSFGQAASPSAYFQQTPLNTVPKVCQFSAGLNVYCPSNISDNGEELLYNGQPVGGSTPSAIRYPNATAGLAPNTGLVPAEPYAQPVTSGSANFGPSTGQTSRNWISFGHLYRFRQTGTVTQVKIDVPVITGITGFYISNCRTSTIADTTPALVDTISTSPNLVSSMVAGINTFTISPGLTVVTGDYMCGRVEWSGGATVQNLYTPASVSATGETASVYYVDNATPAASQYNYAGQSVASGVVVLAEGDMTPPVLACTGDSIDSGAKTSYSFSDVFSNLTAKKISYCDLVAQTMGVTSQNFGHAGYTAAQISSLFATGPATVNAKYVLLEGGVNDILASISLSTIQASWTSMLQAAQTANEIPIIIGVMPFASSQSTNQVADMTERDQLNAWLVTQASVYGGLYINTDPYIGAFYSGGPANNLWQMNPPYAGSDLLHPSYPLGETRIAQAVIDGFAAANSIPDIPAALPAGPFSGTTAGAANTYTVTVPGLELLSNSNTNNIPSGTMLTISIATSNTGATTLSVNGGTAEPVVQASSSAPFIGGEFLAGQFYTLYYNSTVPQWQTISPLGSTAQLLNGRVFSTPDGVNRYNYALNSSTFSYGPAGVSHAWRVTGSSTNECTITSSGSSGFMGCLAFYPNGRITATAAAGTNVTSITCVSTCTNQESQWSIVGGSATTGTIATLSWAATPAVWHCKATQNGGASFYGIGTGTVLSTGVPITAGATVSGATIIVDVSCQPF